MRIKIALAIVLCFSLIPTMQAQKVNPAKDWNLGIALWTFHTMNFPQSLDHVDSTGLKFIEPNTFHETGPDFNHLIVSKLSNEQLEKLKQMVASHGLKLESIYIAGGTTLQSWKEQFDIARQLGVQFVTAEPPLHLLDSVDHLAGEYHIKVAIHEHWKGVSIYWHPDSVLAALKGHPNFGACADLGHWPKSGINPVDGVKKLKGHIISIHLKDIAAYNNPKLVDVRVGTGVVDFPAVFRELKSQGFKGNIYIERDEVEKPSNLASVIKTIQYYNEQIGKLK